MAGSDDARGEAAPGLPTRGAGRRRIQVYRGTGQEPSAGAREPAAAEHGVECVAPGGTAPVRAEPVNAKPAEGSGTSGGAERVAHVATG